MRHARVRVVRAREKRSTSGRMFTSVDIRISGVVVSTRGDWIPLTGYGPRHIRNFLRRRNNHVLNTVNSWTKLWGFPSSPDITIKTIELVNNPCKV